MQGLDLSNGFGVMLSLYKGSMLIGNSSAKAKGIYSLDIQTGEVSKEPLLPTVGNPILCYYFEKYTICSRSTAISAMRVSADLILAESSLKWADAAAAFSERTA